MSVEPWRIAIVSESPPSVARIYEVAKTAGRLPVAHLFVRGLQQDTVAPFHAYLTRLLVESPPELVQLLPARREQIAPLLRSVEPDLVLCASFPWRLPDNALAVPRLGAINIHPSALPKYRGSLPVEWAMRNGETELGVTVHRMDESFDTGGILAQGRVPIEEDDDGDALYARARELWRELLPRAFERIAAGDPGDAQDDAVASYAGVMEPEFLYVDWKRPASEIHNQVRAWRVGMMIDGKQGPIAELDGQQVRILRTRLVPGDGREVRCGGGSIWVLESVPIQ